jgi:hypothetical protein
MASAKPPPFLVFLERVQSQVADANLGARSLNALFGVLNPIPVVSLEIALLGDGSGAPCLLSMDIVIVGVRSKPKRAEIAAMIAWARSMAQDTIAARLLPPTMHGIPTIDLLAAVFLYTAETPYPLYSCLTVPLNVTGVRTLQSLLHQLPFMKLFSLGLRCLPKCAPYLFQGALYRGVDVSKNPSFKAKYDSYSTAYQVGSVLIFAAPTSFSTSDQAAGVFCNGIQFVAPDTVGTQLHDLTAFDGEGEVIIDGPSWWQVQAATMTPTGTLVVVIKRAQSAVHFLTDDDGDHQSRDVVVDDHAQRASARSLSQLSVPDVALIVSCRGTAFEGYSPAIISNGLGGDVIDMLDVNDLEKLMESMAISTNHRLVLKATFSAWKQNPDKAFEALGTAKVAGRARVLFTSLRMSAGRSRQESRTRGS